MNASDESKNKNRINKTEKMWELLHGKLSLKMKRIYQSCVKSAMLYESETRCQRENEMTILRIEKVLIRAMSGAKLIKKRSNQELKNLLGLEKNLNRLAGASGVQWYGHVLKMDSDDELRRALDFEVVGRRGGGQPNMMW